MVTQPNTQLCPAATASASPQTPAEGGRLLLRRKRRGNSDPCASAGQREFPAHHLL